MSNEEFLKIAKKELGVNFNREEMVRSLLQDNVTPLPSNLIPKPETPKPLILLHKPTGSQTIKVTHHNEVCQKAQEKLSSNFKAVTLQKPIPDLIVILEDGSIVAVEYETGYDLEHKLPLYEGSSYDYILIVNVNREIILKKEGTMNILRPDLKDFFKPILSTFQIKPKII